MKPSHVWKSPQTYHQTVILLWSHLQKPFITHPGAQKSVVQSQINNDFFLQTTGPRTNPQCATSWWSTSRITSLQVTALTKLHCNQNTQNYFLHHLNQTHKLPHWFLLQRQHQPPPSTNSPSDNGPALRSPCLRHTLAYLKAATW